MLSNNYDVLQQLSHCADCNGKPVRNLAEHRRNVHRADSRAGCANLRPAPCGQCGKVFSTAYAAKYHAQGCHSVSMHNFRMQDDFPRYICRVKHLSGR